MGECGFAGIKEDVCKKTGCCWDNSIKGVKWCFQPKDKKEDCQKSSTKGKDYRGTVSVTKSGKTCQAWNVQSPQKHGTYTEKNREESGLGEHNYCRNVGGNDVGVWCYTTDPNKRLDYCDVPVCEDKTEDCQKSSTKGKDYRGTASVTKSGKTCQAWNVQSPQKHGTYT